MTPTEHEGTVAVDAGARKLYDTVWHEGLPPFDELDILEQNRLRESVLSVVWAALEALPDRSKTALIEAAQDLREHVHDRMRPDTWQRDVGDHACTWLERRADLIGADHG